MYKCPLCPKEYTSFVRLQKHSRQRNHPLILSKSSYDNLHYARLRDHLIQQQQHQEPQTQAQTWYLTQIGIDKESPIRHDELLSVVNTPNHDVESFKLLSESSERIETQSDFLTSNHTDSDPKMPQYHTSNERQTDDIDFESYLCHDLYVSDFLWSIETQTISPSISTDHLNFKF